MKQQAIWPRLYITSIYRRYENKILAFFAELCIMKREHRRKENADMMTSLILLAVVIRIIVSIIVVCENAYLRYAESKVICY